MCKVPAEIKRKHLDDPKNKKAPPEKVLSFGREKFMLDILFTDEHGLCLEPIVFTKGTKDLPASQRVPSRSIKDHLPYFENKGWRVTYRGVNDDKPTSKSWVEGVIEYQKITKMLSTYVGREHDPVKKKPTGFWQHLVKSGTSYIYPSYKLHSTVTGRTSSENPNGQNIPKRGKLAKMFRAIFVAPPGWKILEVDLSQAELRIAAWMAMEPTMLRIYREGGDIHSATAATVMRISIEEFNRLPEEVRKRKRQEAKSVIMICICVLTYYVFIYIYITICES